MKNQLAINVKIASSLLTRDLAVLVLKDKRSTEILVFNAIHLFLTAPIMIVDSVISVKLVTTKVMLLLLAWLIFLSVVSMIMLTVTFAKLNMP